jgi:hypothetical protein
MINIKDIMVGNFIKNSEGEIVKVEKIYEGGVSCNCRVLCYEDTIEPIPATVEILKRIGFKEYDACGEYIYYRYWDDGYKYKIDIRKDWCNSPRDWHVHIDNGDYCTIGCGEVDYVHQLQNLVRVITGRDLPITKEMLQ